MDTRHRVNIRETTAGTESRADYAKEYELGQKAELNRLRFLVQRDSYPSAAQWALNTLRGYRLCLLSSGRHGRAFHFASQPPYRERFLASYVVMKAFVAIARQRGVLPERTAQNYSVPLAQLNADVARSLLQPP
jgi:hypothetical protein